eukprot:TRINITY_DN15088_c0_g1_i3.p1 TRINITY_DN15088_c0_g1~~TRINITY_DN15088_c0_g1_i3.p1  ORF type:complete len:545 (-),score=104.88 TRINITY_DN15088_c0_g1_i3:41-1675(-)
MESKTGGASATIDDELDEALDAVSAAPERKGSKRHVDAQEIQNPAQPSRQRRARTPSSAAEASADGEMPQSEENSGDEPGCQKEREIKRLQTELAEQKIQLQRLRVNANRARCVISQSLVEIAKGERLRLREWLFNEAKRVGKMRSSLAFEQDHSWEGGAEMEAIEKAKSRARQERESLEQLRRSLPKQSKSKAAEVDEAESVGNTDDDDLWEVRDVCSHRSEYLKREEAGIKERENRLSADRKLYLRRLNVARFEDTSTLRHYPLIKERFQLLNMIGKGGFGEVYKAFDFEHMCTCAVKIIEINTQMSHAQRQNTVKWALREYTIQKSLQHPRIVQLQEYFALSETSLAIVLELCEGETLDTRLQANGAFPEREAKTIVIQILSALKYLNSNGRRIIHYDIKPGNIFYHTGQVKLGDFGLSKNAPETPEGVLELSTPGVGTFWYLPPECHESGFPKISSKVDVWSTGVVFYQLLFNRRPFGHGQSLESFRLSTSMDGTFDLVIPQSPKVSTGAKEFLGRLFTKDREQRPDVHDVLMDPYLRKK